MADAMNLRPLMARAAEVPVTVVSAIGSGQLDLPTPCTEYDVRTLLNHLIYWTGAPAEAAARRRPRPETPEEGHDFTAEPGWAGRYAIRARATAAAWSEPAAWEGETGLSGQATMPAQMIGGMMFAEFLFHGWDLAVATGQQPAVDDDVADALFAQAAAMGDMARRYGAVGPEVAVPETAPAFDRALGLAGRDPAWRP